MSPDDQLYLYEVVGIVIINGERGAEKTELMKKVVTPLLATCRIVTDQLGMEKDPRRSEELTNVIIQAVSVTGRLSKAFSNNLSMKSFNCVPLFLDALQVFIRSVEVPIYLITKIRRASAGNLFILCFHRFQMGRIKLLCKVVRGNICTEWWSAWKKNCYRTFPWLPKRY